MPYYTGAQGPQSAYGAQGPTLQGPVGAQAPWGLQGPVANKRQPFSVNSGLTLTGNLTLLLIYNFTDGKQFGVYVQRPVPTNADLLSVLPDDVVQMANIISFRPQQGIFHTLAMGTGIAYNVVELTGSSLLSVLTSHVSPSDTNTTPNYTQNEIGL